MTDNENHTGGALNTEYSFKSSGDGLSDVNKAVKELPIRAKEGFVRLEITYRKGRYRRMFVSMDGRDLTE